MELRHLRYFMVVGEEQHYGRASRRLRVAQPALSRQIQDLEDEIGFKLFDRLPRGVKLSAAGKLFLEDARRILQAVSEATARAARVARGQSGTLRVGFPENASWHGVVPDSFRRFRERYPEGDCSFNRRRVWNSWTLYDPAASMGGSSISCQKPTWKWTSLSSAYSMSSWPCPTGILSQNSKSFACETWWMCRLSGFREGQVRRSTTA
jgi:hypothetical protein